MGTEGCLLLDPEKCKIQTLDLGACSTKKGYNHKFLSTDTMLISPSLKFSLE